MTAKRNKTEQIAAESAGRQLAGNVSVAVPLGPGRRGELGLLEKALAVQTVQPLEVVVEEALDHNNHYVNRNKAWRRAKGGIIWFLDSDAIPEPDALERALETFAENDAEGVEGHVYGQIERVHKWGFMTIHIFYTREALEKVGGFDERFTDWRGDTDLAWSIIDAGGLILYQPLSRVCHPNLSNTRPDLEMERLFYGKHPALYREAREKNYLQCFINE